MICIVMLYKCNLFILIQLYYSVKFIHLMEFEFYLTHLSKRVFVCFFIFLGKKIVHNDDLKMAKELK